jgi:hypothetical protein
MKHLLNGVMIAAALMIAAPVWAQTGAPMSTPMSPSAAPSAGMAPDEPVASAPRHRARPHRAARHAGARSRGGKTGADNAANQLNQQELSRMQTGGGAAPMAPGPMPMPQEGPRPGRGR